MVDALDLMLARRSIRRYTNADVSAEHEDRLLRAAFAAPSADNHRPWHFVVVRDRETRQRLAAVHEWARMVTESPLVIVVLGQVSAPWWIEDCSAATENVLLEAQELGLGAVWVGVRDGEPGAGGEQFVREILGVPDGWGVLCLIPVGHPAQAKSPRTQVETTKISYDRFAQTKTHHRAEV